MKKGDLQTGEIAALSGVSVDTVRYYERLKLLPRAARSNGGFRIFPAETVERIKFIKQAQETGFSLEEIKQLFSTGGGANQCRAVQELLSKKLSELEAKIKQMRNFKAVLSRHLTDCENELEAHGEESACPVLTTIEKIK
ncbi:MAG TPA: heavy metal-responsive transcriptional regulator [Pyrinomonadaceae bacterium]|jgi:MerR family mercuric resistance operon transcriptional regulator|nr:heavy metal-responsive transcriptional regulator [Pyrinomonadaceae bacterium]